MKEIYITIVGTEFLEGTIVKKLNESGKYMRILCYQISDDKAVKYLLKQFKTIQGKLYNMKSLKRFFDIPDDSEFVCLYIASIVTINPSYNKKVMYVNISGTKSII